MKKLYLALAIVGMTLSVVKDVSAQGLISTDRFGYTGVVQRYATLADAQAGTNQSPLSNTNIGNRDLSIYVVQGMPSVSLDMNILMGSWWYTTEPSNLHPAGYDTDGYGNVRGNSGVGFIQLYDDNASTTETSSFGFSGFDGTYWNDFNFSLSGKNADYANDSSRMWVNYQGPGADKVSFLNYSISLTASGLQGVQTGDIIEANNHPTQVNGSFTALFQNVSTTYPANNGFYKMELTLDMDNWAYSQANALTGIHAYNSIAPSQFVAKAPSSVPDGGATAGLIGLTLGLMAFYRQKHS